MVVFGEPVVPSQGHSGAQADAYRDSDMGLVAVADARKTKRAGLVMLCLVPSLVAVFTTVKATANSSAQFHVVFSVADEVVLHGLV